MFENNSAIIFSVYDDHLHAIKNVVLAANHTDSIFVFGDFNLPSVSWNHLPDTPNMVPIYTNLHSDNFLNELSDLCLFQMNYIQNNKGKILDLVFVNDPTDCSIKRSIPVTTHEDLTTRLWI